MVEFIEKIESKDDWIRFLNLLAKDFEEHPNEWENPTIPAFLEQMASWVEDYSDSPANDINWNTIPFKIFAQILYMGKLYE